MKPRLFNDINDQREGTDEDKCLEKMTSLNKRLIGTLV